MAHSDRGDDLALIPPRRGPEPLCFQPLLPLEHPDDQTPIADFSLSMLVALAGVWIVVVLAAAWLVGGQ